MDDGVAAQPHTVPGSGAPRYITNYRTTQPAADLHSRLALAIVHPMRSSLVTTPTEGSI